MRRLALLLAGSALLARPAAGQSGALEIVPITPVLLEQAEGERIACRRLRAQEQLTPRFAGGGLYDFALDGALPMRWRITLLDSRRTVTLGLLRNYVPRELVVDAGREAGTQAFHEAVRVRFLPDGSTQDGARVVSAARRGRPVETPLDSLDGPQLYLLARELAFRCDRNIVEPVPLGSILGQIPPA
jgi:hypothetical protein